MVSISTVLGLALAIIVALMRISQKINVNLCYFVYLIRGTPVIVIVFCLLWSWSIFIYSRKYIVHLKRAILVWYHYTDDQHWCYSSEIIRGGILSVSKNLIEASGH